MQHERDLSTGIAALTAVVLVLTVLAGLVAWGVIAGAHAGDTYLTTHVSGTRMTLARSLHHGVLYPPLYDGHHYGGTRIMPIPILLHAAAARLTGEYLMSGKLLGYATLVALLTAVFVLLRRLRCPVPLALILPASLLVIEPGYRAAFSIQGDALPVLLQLLAISSVLKTGRSGIVAGAALSALAFMMKLSALWAPMAIGVWLAVRHRERLLLFAPTYAIVIAALMGVFNVASGGRFFENVFGLSLAGIEDLHRAIRSPIHLLRTLFFNTPALWALVPAGALAAGISFGRRNPSIYDIALICHAPLLLVIFADIGASANHLLDLAVLSVLAMGHAASYGSPGGAGSRAAPLQDHWWRLTNVQAVVGLLFVWVTATQLVVLVPDVHTAVTALRTGLTRPARPLEPWISAEDAILSEDPYVPISLGQTPVVADPFMLRRIAERDPEAVRALIRRIEAREFDFVVLVFPLERAWWWDRFHFGSSVMEAVGRAYKFSARAEGYYLYEPGKD